MSNQQGQVWIRIQTYWVWVGLDPYLDPGLWIHLKTRPNPTQTQWVWIRIQTHSEPYAALSLLYFAMLLL
jgi:hypothetical protein